MSKQKLFLASSSELKQDREQFEIFINRKNKDWHAQGVFIELVVWEDFLDAFSQTRLQDEYNQAIRECDLFVMLLGTKVGQYTEEEFETAFGQFHATRRPFIFTYFKDAQISTASTSKKDLISLWAFQEKLGALGHFYTVYKNTEELLYQFNRQLDKLAANGFIELDAQNGDPDSSPAMRYPANQSGGGAIVQGSGTAVGARGVQIGGNNNGNINTGTRIDTGGGANVGGNVHADGDFIGRDKITHSSTWNSLEPLFAQLLADVSQQASAENRRSAIDKVQDLKSEIDLDKKPDDSKVAKIVEALAALAPGAFASIEKLLSAPILKNWIGPVTRLVLDRLQGKSGAS